MVITSTDILDGKNGTKVLGLVRGNSVRARAIGKDITAMFHNIVVGELPEYTR